MHRIPHPSGVAILGELELCGDTCDTFEATRDEAMRLFERRIILHPDTGVVKPPRPPPSMGSESRVTMSNGRNAFFGGSMEWRQELARAEQIASLEAQAAMNAAIDERNARREPNSQQERRWSAGRRPTRTVAR